MVAGTEDLLKPHAPSAEKSRKVLGWGFLALWLIGAILLLRSPWLTSWLSHFQSTQAALQSHGPWGAFIFTASIAGLVALGFPRLILCGLAGAAYGAIPGVVISQVGSTFGAYANFLLVRCCGPFAKAKEVREKKRWQQLIEHHAFWGVVLARQLPVSGLVVNALLALTSVRHGTFLLGSFLGFLPEGLIAVLLGSGVGKEKVSHAIMHIVIAVVFVIAIIFWRRRSPRPTNAPSLPTDH